MWGALLPQPWVQSRRGAPPSPIPARGRRAHPGEQLSIITVPPLVAVFPPPSAVFAERFKFKNQTLMPQVAPQGADSLAAALRIPSVNLGPPHAVSLVPTGPLSPP